MPRSGQVDYLSVILKKEEEMKRAICIKLIIPLFCLYAVNIGAASESKSTASDIYPKTTYDGVIKLFEKYKCPVEYTSLKGELDKKSLDNTVFKTRIREGSKGEVNFGGKFIIIEWGCGTQCETGAMVDLSTGIIYEIPTSSQGKEYREDSLLLIVNPPTEDPADNVRPYYAYPAYYLWKDNKFELLYDSRESE